MSQDDGAAPVDIGAGLGTDRRTLRTVVVDVTAFEAAPGSSDDPG